VEGQCQTQGANAETIEQATEFDVARSVRIPLGQHEHSASGALSVIAVVVFNILLGESAGKSAR
jgi:hypothetical protein